MEENATLFEAVPAAAVAGAKWSAGVRMAVSARDYLFVVDGNIVEGIMSLSDVMGHICDTVRACRL